MRRSAMQITIDLPLDIERGKHDLFYVTSPLIRGLLVGAETVEAALKQVPDSVAALVQAIREARS